MSRPPAVIDPTTLSQLLAHLLNPNTDAIRQVEATLRTALVQPAFVCDLFEILQHSPAPELRQLAAVLVRRRIGANWTKLDASVRVGLQAVLLNRLTVEPERVVRRQMTSVVSVVARHALPNGTWPELFGFLFECTRSSAAEHRELSMLLLASLLESEDVVESSLRPHFGMLSTTLQTLLADHTSPHVRQATLKAVGAWAGVLIAEEAISSLQPLLGPMLDLCRTAAQSSDEDSLCLAFEIFQEVLDEPSSTLIAPHLADLVGLVVAAATEPSMEEETRMAALNLIGRTLENKRKLLVKHKLVPAIVAKLFEACASTEDGDGQLAEMPASNDDDNDDDDSVHRRSAQVLHTLGTALPSKHAAPPVLEVAAQYAQSPRAGHRRAAFIALAMTAEGFCEFLRAPPSVAPHPLCWLPGLDSGGAGGGLHRPGRVCSASAARDHLALPASAAARLHGTPALEKQGHTQSRARTRARAPAPVARAARAPRHPSRRPRAHAPAPVAEAAPTDAQRNARRDDEQRIVLIFSPNAPQDGGCGKLSWFDRALGTCARARGREREPPPRHSQPIHSLPRVLAWRPPEALPNGPTLSPVAHL